MSSKSVYLLFTSRSELYIEILDFTVILTTMDATTSKFSFIKPL